jgi:hypothetical protein
MNTSTARTQRKWQIRGFREDGGRLAFPVLAYDHTEAARLAKKKAKNGCVTDVFLLDGDKEKIRVRAIQAAKGR